MQRRSLSSVIFRRAWAESASGDSKQKALSKFYKAEPCNIRTNRLFHSVYTRMNCRIWN